MSRPLAVASKKDGIESEIASVGKLSEILEGSIVKALRLLSDGGVPGGEPSPAAGLMGRLKRRLDVESDAVRKKQLAGVLADLRAYFYAPSPGLAETTNGQVLVNASADALTAYLTVTPPRGTGSIPTTNRVMAAFHQINVKYGVDMEAVEKALKIVREDGDVVWRTVVARGEPPIQGRREWVDFDVPVVDKTALRASIDSFSSLFSSLWDPVKEDDVIGRVREPEPGVPGKTVFGASLRAERTGDRPIDFGEGIERGKDDVLTARASGYVVTDSNRVDIIPFYIMDPPKAGSGDDLSFPGAVFVRGDLQGFGTIQCEDVFVQGNCEHVKIIAQGDVFISGGVMGHRRTSIDADGGVYTAFVSEAKVSALGEIVVSNAVINSHVTSNDSVRVTSEKGMITGGTTQALKDIVVQTIGSEFGMLTETVVGKDFLTTQRLEVIREKIRLHENNLYRIQNLKQELVKARVRVEELPPEKQEIYIGVLRKEAQSRTELQSLTRKKKRLRQSLQEFLSASVQVLKSLYPPFRVQIVNEIKDVKEKLNAVTLKYDVHQGIVSRFSPCSDNPEE